MRHHQKPHRLAHRTPCRPQPTQAPCHQRQPRKRRAHSQTSCPPWPPSRPPAPPALQAHRLTHAQSSHFGEPFESGLEPTLAKIPQCRGTPDCSPPKPGTNEARPQAAQKCHTQFPAPDAAAVLAHTDRYTHATSSAFPPDPAEAPLSIPPLPVCLAVYPAASLHRPRSFA